MLNIIVLTNNSNTTNLHVDNYCVVMRLVLWWLWYLKQQSPTNINVFTPVLSIIT